MSNSAHDASDRVVGPLRAARRPIHDGLRQIQKAATALDAEPKVALAALRTALRYLKEEYLPHQQAEEFVLFPAVDGVVGAMGASDIMRAQHKAIEAMIHDAGQVVDAAQKDGDAAAYANYLVPLLNGLYAAIRLHIEAEDTIWVGLLDDHLSESQVGVIVDNLERISSARREALLST